MKTLSYKIITNIYNNVSITNISSKLGYFLFIQFAALTYILDNTRKIYRPLKDSNWKLVQTTAVSENTKRKRLC